MYYTRKISLVFIILGWSSLYCLKAQEIKPLKIGDKLPDIVLGKWFKSLEGGKLGNPSNLKAWQNEKTLVVYDFWATWCTSCIENFEHLSALQQKFGDDIIIYLVNTDEDESKIREWADKLFNKGRQVIPTNLIVVCDNGSLKKLFPPRHATGYHVWTNDQNQVVLRGIHENTNEKKIRDALSLKKIEFVEDNALRYDKKLPLLIDGNNNQYLSMASAFASFSDKIADPYGQVAINIRDSISLTIRNTFANWTVENLYRYAFGDMLKSDSLVLFGDKVRLEVSDIEAITIDPRNTGVPISDYSYREAQYCYEQIVPQKMSIDLRKNFMVADLNRYFKVTLGIVGTIESREINCFILKQIDETRTFKRSHGTVAKSHFDYSGQGKVYQVFEKYDLHTAFIEYFSSGNSTCLKKGDVIIDGVRSNEIVDLRLPLFAEVSSIEQLNKVLKKYNLEIGRGYQKLDMLVLSDVNR